MESDNCEFVGWFTAKTGGTEVTKDTEFTENTTVYAHWDGWTQDGTTVNIFGNGPMDDFSSPDYEAPWSIESIESIEHVVIEPGVTRIGIGAFYNCRNLKLVTIPETVTSIGDHAFAECISLSEIDIPNGVTSIEQSTFNLCSSLTSILIPDSVTSIGESAFSGCSSLASISIPNSVTSIGSNAFKDCPLLLNVTYKGTKAQWDAISGLNGSGLSGKTIDCTDGTINAPSARMLSRRRLTTYTVTLDAVGGSVSADVCWTDADGKLTGLPDPVWEDHVFAGWYTAEVDGERITSDTVFDHDTTIFAHWKEKAAAQSSLAGAPFTIRLYGCGGVVPEASLKTDGDGRLETLPSPVRDGYVFAGWYTDRTGGSRIAADSVFSEDSVLYAHWTAAGPAPSASPQQQYSVRFDACGGTVGPEALTTDEDGRLSVLPAPDWKGHSFIGWYTAETGGSKVSRSTVFTKNMTLYAHWEDSAQASATPASDNMFTIRFDACGGIVKPESMKTDEAGRLSTLPVPEREDYTFLGWYTDPEDGTKASANTVFEKNTKLFAHWAEVEPAPPADDMAAGASADPDSGTKAGIGPESTGSADTAVSSEQN